MPASSPTDPDGAPRKLDAAESLRQARACYERSEWDDAFDAFSRADRLEPLGAEDLYRLAWSAGLTARDEQMLVSLERVYNARLAADEVLPAARAAFWLGFRLFALGETGRASGWLSRAQRHVDLLGHDCVERGYLLLPAAQRHLNAGEFDAAHDCAARAAQVGERFDEADLTAFARNQQGRALLGQGRILQGLALLDEAMIAVIAGELSPVVTGILYCSSIASCQRVYAYGRCREWTAALTRWCDGNPQLGLFTGHCLVHRAQVLELGGSWSESVDEARRAVRRCVSVIEREAAGYAHYQQGEIHRLRGDFALAEEAYREAGRAGFEPQPGLALLRLAEGQAETAATASHRALGAVRDPLARTRLLPAHVEIMLAAGDLAAARDASRELDEVTASVNTDVLVAIAERARGAVLLADGHAGAALDPLRQAFATWQRLDAPYLAARLRVLLGRACHALGDAEGARLEFEFASEVFEQLGARPDLEAAQAMVAAIDDRRDDRRAGEQGEARGLTGRELQVLRLIAHGKTNKAIARELSLSQKTIDRHVSNIFAKTGVASRAAATAFAYQHKLI